MSDLHQRYRYSVTLETGDAAVLHCLRALCQHAERALSPQIGWGGTGEGAWKAQGGRFTLRFTDPSYREHFLAEARRLLSGHWTELSLSDSDPASPQR